MVHDIRDEALIERSIKMRRITHFLLYFTFQKTRSKTLHSYTDISLSITQINIQFDNSIFGFLPAGVAHPGSHVLCTGGEDAQRLQKKWHKRLVGNMVQIYGQAY